MFFSCFFVQRHVGSGFSLIYGLLDSLIGLSISHCNLLLFIYFMLITYVLVVSTTASYAGGMGVRIPDPPISKMCAKDIFLGNLLRLTPPIDRGLNEKGIP